MDKIKVFVYGTLKRGQGLNNHYMHNSTFLKTDKVKGKLYSLGAYPGLRKGDNDVPGEIFEMPKEDFFDVKRMEEGAGYETEEVTTESGIQVSIFFYKHEIKETQLITEW